MIFESRVDISKIWYFGNNRANNLKLAPPKWYSPFFLTTDYNYAEEYSDYGVYTITLKSEAKSKILDFNKDSDVKKLKWPKKLIDEIRTGKSDLNAIAYDMYILCGLGDGQLQRLSNGPTWRAIAHQFDQKSRNLQRQLPPNASWGQDKDHRFVIQMWKDIHDVGFDGFTHVEFGKQILALFDFKCMDKISVQQANKPLNEDEVSADLTLAFDEVVSKYKNIFGFDLSYMTFKVDSQPVYTNGQPCYEYDEDECAGDWTSLGWIRLNPDMKSVMDRYGVDGDISQFTKIIIAHELAHEVWNNIADDQFKEEILDEARRQSFNTAYLDTVRHSKLAEETFCEYLAHKITQHSFSSIDNQET